MIRVQDIADLHGEHDKYYGRDGRKRDVPSHAPALAAVDRRRFVQIRIDARNRGDIDDRIPAEALPDVRHDVNRAERSRIADQRALVRGY